MSLRTAMGLLALVSLSCSTAFEAQPVPSPYRTGSVQDFVENHGQDRRRIDQMIAGELRASGLHASSGMHAERPAQFDVLVLHEDRWQWDMSNYLIFLRIDLRDPKTNVLIATGSSYQSSLARKSPEEVVRRILTGMLGSGS